MSDGKEIRDSKDPSNSIARIAKAIKGIRIAMLTTADPDGILRSRPMATQEVEFDGTIWFITKEESGKVNSIEHDQRVNVAYADPSADRYVSITGTARLTNDPKKIKELWTPLLRAWFPDGENDPQIALIQIEVGTAEIWDAPAGKLLELISLVKSAVTGRPYEWEKHHDKVELMKH